MKISIVIPVYNAEKTISQTVKATLDQDLPDCEVIVVDDGSTDRTSELVKKYSVKYIRQKNAGPASARNTGWMASSGEFVLFTDSDCVPKHDWAIELLAGFKDESIAAVCGSYEIANPEKLLPRLIHEEIKYRHIGYKGTVKFFGSYNVAIRRNVIERTRGFDESYKKASAEDNDLSYRILKLGYKIAFSPDALVAHHHTETLKKYLKEQYRHGFWRMKLYKNHPDMTGGDDYTRLKDIIEPPLAILNLGLFLFLPYAPLLFFIVTALLVMIQIPVSLKIAFFQKNTSCLLLIPITFLRGYARGIGMFSGFIRFFLRDMS